MYECIVVLFTCVYFSLFKGHLLEQGFLPGCPVGILCIIFMSTNKFDLIDLI